MGFPRKFRVTFRFKRLPGEAYYDAKHYNETLTACNITEVRSVYTKAFPGRFIINIVPV